MLGGWVCYLVIGSPGVSALGFHVVGGADNFARLLQGVLSFAGDEEASNGSIRMHKVCVSMLETQSMKEGASRVKGLDGTGVWKSVADQGGRRHEDIQLQFIDEGVN